MPDEPNNQQQQTPPNPGEPPLPNDPASRNVDGSLKDQQQPPLNTNQQNEPPKKEEPKADGEPKKEEPKKEEPKKDEVALTGAPDKYEPYKIPEGFELNEERVTAFNELAKKLNLSQAGAQEMINAHVDEVTKAMEQPYEDFVNTRKQWRKDMAADTEIGNGKDDLKPEVKANMAAMISSLPTELQPAFKEAMVLTGAGDNPAFVKAVNFWSKGFTEGKPVTPGNPSPASQPGGGNQSAAQVMYPNLPSANSPR